MRPHHHSNAYRIEKRKSVLLHIVGYIALIPATYCGIKGIYALLTFVGF